MDGLYAEIVVMAAGIAIALFAMLLCYWSLGKCHVTEDIPSTRQSKVCSSLEFALA